MLQAELFRIDNPCIGVCQMNKKGYCIGCLRKRSERQNWYRLSDSDKHKILVLLAKRRQRLGDHRLKKRHATDDITSLTQLTLIQLTDP
ncbi:DUF1289 domain-containing protein [Moraxella canis]|uniref:DUF1289 domain-containing protein n=2 Tax=Moraxella canis TaxID=90239 RepID=A0ABZ0X080_9GAMM|nr:DUF1289 domain-containing protein [Moraxella canis]WQE04871.1 DUF1289 domain-containing protein [Moraxella canis]